MANGYKIADGYVEVHLREDLDGELKKKLAKVGTREGEAIGRRIARGVGDGVSDVDTRVQRHLNKIDGTGAGTRTGREWLTGFTTSAGRLPGEMERTGDRAGTGFSRGFERRSGRIGIAAKAALAALPAAGLAAGALMGAGIAGAGAAIAGLGVLALRSNAEVAEAYGSMAEKVTRGVKTAAEPLVPYFVAIAGDIERSFAQVEPGLDDLFSAAGPNLRILAGGVLDLAENALPGFTDAMRTGRHEAEGFASFLGSAGSGVGGFFREIAKGGEDTKTTLTVLGDVVENLLIRTGQALTFLSEGFGGIARDFAPTVDDLLGFLGQLGAGFFPTLLSVFSGVLNVVSGVTTVLGPVAPLLGGIGAAALVGAAGLKVFEGASRLLGGSAASGVAKFGTASQRTAGQTRSLSTRVGAFASFLGGPWGIGIGIATLGLGVLGDRMQESAQRAQATEDRVKGLRDAVAQSGGVITSQTRAFIDQTVAAGNLTAGLKDAGITQSLMTAAIEDQGNALPIVTAAFEKMIAQSTRSNGALSEETLSLQRNAAEFYQLAAARKAAADAAKAQSDAMRDSSGYMFQQAQSTQELADAFAKYGLNSKNAADNLTALQGIVRGTAPELTTVADAQQVWNDRLRAMNEEIKGGIDKTDGFGKSLLNADKTLNTMSGNGSKLRTFLTGAREDMVTLGKSVFDESQRMGDSVQVSSEKAKKALDGQRDSVLKVAKAFGITGKDADDLLRSMNLFPDEIVSKIRLAGATELTRELAGVDAMLDRVRPGVPVRVNALTNDAVAKLTELGFKVEQLEDNSWQVSIEDGAARGKLDTFLRDAEAGLLKPKEIGVKTDAARQAITDFAAWAAEPDTGPYVAVNADASSAYEVAEEFYNSAWNADPTVPVAADPTSAYEELREFLGTAEGSWADPDIGANTVPATDAVGGFLGWAESSWATPEIGANTGPAYGTTSGFLGWADGAWATSNIGADASSAYAEANAAIRAINGRVATIVIRGNYVGSTGGLGYSGAQFASGGVWDPDAVNAFPTGGITPGYTPGVDVHTFRSRTGGTLRLSGGEAIMRPEWTREVGRGYVEAANAAARAGQARRFLAAQASSDNMAVRTQAFAGGGVNGAPSAPVVGAAPTMPSGPGIDYDRLADAIVSGLTRAKLTLDQRAGAVMAQIVGNRQLSNAGR